MDREKVIKGLEICIDRIPGKYSCNECPYEIDGNYCEINLAKDALALLKEQPKECKSCGTVFDIAYKAGKESIVRCKDCKYGEPWGVLIGCGTAKGFGITHKPDWFCADGDLQTDQTGQ